MNLFSNFFIWFHLQVSKLLEYEDFFIGGDKTTSHKYLTKHSFCGFDVLLVTITAIPLI